MISLKESILSSTNTGSFTIGKELKVDELECIVVYKDNKEAWVLTNPAFNYASHIEDAEDDVKKYAKKYPGWDLMSIEDVNKIDFAKHFPGPEKTKVFPHTFFDVWLKDGYVMFCPSFEVSTFKKDGIKNLVVFIKKIKLK